MTQPTVHASLTIADHAYRVLGYRLVQAIDAVDSVTCELDGTLFEIEAPETFVGQAARFALELEGGSVEQAFLGDVIAAEDQLETDGVRHVELTIAAPLWRLGQRLQSQIFQKLTLQQIVQAQLDEAGVTTRVEWHGQAHLTSLAYVVQFEESDLAFVMRLTAEYGISVGYEVLDGKAKIWFSDLPQKRKSGAPLELPFYTQFGDDPSAPHVLDLTQVNRLRPDRSWVAAYDERHAGLTIEGKHDPDQGSSEIYVPLARSRQPQAAQQAAERLVASYQGKRKLIRGVTGYAGLWPGSRISISGHPYGGLNGEFIVLSLRSIGQNAREFSINEALALRSVTFTAMPVEAVLVPDRQPAARVIEGVQTAMTTGPSGDEIHTSEHGEVTVHYPWDRKGKKDETSSRFIRTNQVPTGGSMLLPRVGWEVIVSHHEGDADQPLVMSRLYNAETMPPYSLPDGALKSSLQTGTTPGDGSSNEIRMDDSKGNEQMLFNASKDLSVQVGNNTTQNVGNNLAVTVGANQKQTVIGSVKTTVGANQTVTVSGNQDSSIKTLGVDDVTGNHSATVSGNRIQMIGGDHRREVKGTSQLKVSGNSMTAVVGSVTVETEADFKHDVGAALIHVTGGSRSVTIGGAHSETTGGAKVLVAKGTRSLEVGSLAMTVGGAVIAQVKGDRTDSADGTWTETAGGQEKIEANNVTLEATTKITLTMGGASITLTPASVAISGANIKIDGDLIEISPMIMDN